MEPSEVVEFITGLDNVQQSESFGYQFFFVGDDHRLPFVTIADSDNEYDYVSNLDRDGVYRVNIGISKKTFESLLEDVNVEGLDFSVLNVFLPHPDYWKQHFVCILNPSGANADMTRTLIIEAHSIAADRYRRLNKSQ
ncbi:MAG: DUF6194 family protein [bacterium]|nr:DUF6194 family protein [bacterium]